MAVEGVPLGHFISSHLLHGFCAVCRGKTEIDELIAWRVWAGVNVPEVDEAITAQDGPRSPS